MASTKRWGISIAVAVVAAAGLPAAAAASANNYAWTGLSGDTDWSTPGDWSPTGPPTGTIGTLTFPDLNGKCSSPNVCYFSGNDLGAVSINDLNIDDTDNYLLEYGSTGTPSLSIGAGGVQATATVDSTGDSATISPPVYLTAAQTWTFGGTVNSADNYAGQLDLGNGLNDNGDDDELTLTTNFTGSHSPPVLELGANSDVGQINVDGGVNLQMAAAGIPVVDLNTVDLKPIDINAGSLLSVIDGPASTGPINVTGGYLVTGAGEGGGPGPGGGDIDGSIAATGNVTLDSSSEASFYIDDNGTTPGIDYTQLSSTGNISLGGSGLSLRQGTVGGSDCETMTTGDTATLVSDPTGTISGTFSDVPNGAVVPMNSCNTGSYPMQISYTAHAVTATVLSPGSTTFLSAPSAATINKQVTLTATVTAAGPPTGTIAFSDNNAPISGCGSVVLTVGAGDVATASCTTSFGSAGAHPITASYNSDSGFSSSTSGIETVQVSAGKSPPPPPPAGSGTPTVNSAHVTTTKTSSGTVEVVVPASCASGGASCTVKGTLTATETVRTGKGHKAKKKTRTVVVGAATLTVSAGKSGDITLKLNRTGHKLLVAHHKLRVKLTVTHRVNGKTKTLLTRFITLKS